VRTDASFSAPFSLSQKKSSTPVQLLSVKHLDHILHNVPRDAAAVQNKQTVAWTKIALASVAFGMIHQTAFSRKNGKHFIALFGAGEHALGAFPNAKATGVTWSAMVDAARRSR
jgi:hypothetical protein